MIRCDERRDYSEIKLVRTTFSLTTKARPGFGFHSSYCIEAICGSGRFNAVLARARLGGGGRTLYDIDEAALRHDGAVPATFDGLEERAYTAGCGASRGRGSPVGDAS